MGKLSLAIFGSSKIAFFSPKSPALISSNSPRIIHCFYTLRRAGDQRSSSCWLSASDQRESQENLIIVEPIYVEEPIDVAPFSAMPSTALVLFGVPSAAEA